MIYIIKKGIDKKLIDNDIVVEIKNLKKEYKMFARKKDRLLETVIPGYEKHGTFCAMNDLNLEIRKGEILGILGKNGAGKSTLLKMITGVVTPTSGTINIKGKISSLLELGTAFNSELTGIENIYQHGQVMGLSNEEINKKEKEIIEFADIGDHIFQPVKTYSSGMFARLAFACAINVEPDILIVDEVLSVGDMAFQLKCFKKFEQFKNKNKTIIFVTHGIGDIQRNCTRTIIIDKGTKIFDGDVKQGVEKYKKLIVGIDIDEEEKKVLEKQIEEKEETMKILQKSQIQNKENENINNKSQNIPNLYQNTNTWMEKCNPNPNVISYGNMNAEVIDYGVFDENDNTTSIINNDQLVTLKSKIKFNKEVVNPIFTMTVKDFKGLDMCGTNTIIEQVITGKFEAGETVIATFIQKIPVTPGKYTLSFSCTRFNERGELEALNRKYDALLIEVLSNKECVGLFRIDSRVSFEKV